MTATLSRARLRHLRKWAPIAAAMSTPDKAAAARRNGKLGGKAVDPIDLKWQSRCFAQHVKAGTAPQVGPHLLAYILENSKDDAVRAAAKRAASTRTLWTLTAEAKRARADA
jgi:hypothetical protein